MSNQRLEVITLNCWGLKFISQFTSQRIQHIAEELAISTCDIICLQEIWQQQHWILLKRRLREKFPFAKYYHSGMMGSGLAILSRHPILQTDMRSYTLNGRPQAFFRGDWYVGKGVASAIIELPNGRQCQIFNTHMHAPYNEKVDTYLCHRTAQGWELRKLLQSSVQAGYITFATGDFNSVPGSLVHRFLTNFLYDTFLTLNPVVLAVEDASALDIDVLVDKYGFTCDVSPLNTWRAQQAPGMEPKRLDYIFHDQQVEPKELEVIFRDLVTSANCSPSDHFGLRGVYECLQSGQETHGERSHLYEGDYDEMLGMLQNYTARETLHSARRIGHFWVSLASIVILITTMYRSTSATSQICLAMLILLSGVTAILQGLLGVVFGWWELRNLEEYRDEVSRAQAMHTSSSVGV